MKLSRILSVIVLIMVCPFLLPGCNSSGVETLPTLSGSDMPLPDSSARGRLIIDDGCIRLRSLFPTYGFAIGSSTLLIWPYGYATGVIDGKTVVLDKKGKVINGSDKLDRSSN